MKHSPARPRRRGGFCAAYRGSVLVALLVILSAHAAPLAAQPAAPTPSAPDVLLFVQSTGTGKDWVSFTYPKVVPEAEARADLDRLAAETGWQPENPRITSTSLTEGGENPMTSVEFGTSWAVRLESGGLHVEPLVKTFKRFKRIEVVYVTPQSFTFQGLRQFENKYVKIRLERGTNTYRYSITVKDSGFEILGLPLLQPDITTPSRTDERAGSGSRAPLVVLIVVLALAAGGVTYYIASRCGANGRSDGGQRR